MAHEPCPALVVRHDTIANTPQYTLRSLAGQGPRAKHGAKSPARSNRHHKKEKIQEHEDEDKQGERERERGHGGADNCARAQPCASILPRQDQNGLTPASIRGSKRQPSRGTPVTRPPGLPPCLPALNPDPSRRLPRKPRHPPRFHHRFLYRTQHTAVLRRPIRSYHPIGGDGEPKAPGQRLPSPLPPPPRATA